MDLKSLRVYIRNKKIIFVQEENLNIYILYY